MKKLELNDVIASEYVSPKIFMKTDIYVQARMGSSRLFGKVLLPVLDRPLLFYLVERLRRVQKADTLVILTTILQEDDPIVDFCEANQIAYFRGSSEDVLDRYYQAAQSRKPEAIVRITGDCPLSDPAIIDQIIRVYEQKISEVDYVSNTMERSFPRGLDAELFSYAALEKAYRQSKEAFEKEHVTPYIYLHPEQFRLKSVVAESDFSFYRWTVDTPEDFKLIKLILEHLYPVKPDFGMRDVVSLLKEHPEWQLINTHIVQKTLYEE